MYAAVLTINTTTWRPGLTSNLNERAGKFCKVVNGKATR